MIAYSCLPATKKRHTFKQPGIIYLWDKLFIWLAVLLHLYSCATADKATWFKFLKNII
jgi:hypothetical protein